VAVALGNSGLAKFIEPLERLALSEDALVAEHARWAVDRLLATAVRPRANGAIS
jgi:epoxyqueuosine reductase QueG